MFGVDVGRGVRVGVSVAVGTRVLVVVGRGVSVGTGVGANVEQADTSRAIDRNTITVCVLNLYCIFPPGLDVMTAICIIYPFRLYL